MRGKLANLVMCTAALAPVLCGAAVLPGEGASPISSARPLAPVPVEVQRYVLQLMSGLARVQAEALEMPVRSAERQALVLVSQLRVLNEVPSGNLPDAFRKYVEGRRKMENDLTPRMAAAFLSVASGELEEEELTETLAPLEAEKSSRMEELDAAYPEAAAALGENAMRTRWMSLGSAVGEDARAKVGPAGVYRMMAEKLESILKTL